MNGRTLQKTVQICNPQGFHMRPKANFARVAATFQSGIKLTWTDRTVDGKSMFDLMLLAAPQGDSVVLEVSGSDAEKALETLAAILSDPGEELEEDSLPESMSEPTTR